MTCKDMVQTVTAGEMSQNQSHLVLISCFLLWQTSHRKKLKFIQWSCFVNCSHSILYILFLFALLWSLCSSFHQKKNKMEALNTQASSSQQTHGAPKTPFPIFKSLILLEAVVTPNHRIVESLRLQNANKVIKSKFNQTPPCPWMCHICLFFEPSWGDGDSTTSLESLFQSLMIPGNWRNLSYRFISISQDVLLLLSSIWYSTCSFGTKTLSVQGQVDPAAVQWSMLSLMDQNTAVK